MKINTNKLELSGKVYSCNEFTWNRFNLTAQLGDATLYEVGITEDEEFHPIGWLTSDSITLIADFTLHTQKGMRGKSTTDHLDHALILCNDDFSLLEEGVTLQNENVEDIVPLFKRYKNQKFKIANNSESLINLDRGISFFSLNPEMIMLYHDDTTTRIAENDGIYVLKEGEKPSLTLISDDDGVQHYNEKGGVQIGDEGIKIGEEYLDPEKLVRNITSTLSKTLDNMKFDFKF